MVDPFWMVRTRRSRRRRQAAQNGLSFRYDQLSSKLPVTGAQLASANSGGAASGEIACQPELIDKFEQGAQRRGTVAAARIDRVIGIVGGWMLGQHQLQAAVEQGFAHHEPGE